MNNNLKQIDFANGVANIKEGETVDMEKLRSKRLFGKLMLTKGSSFSNEFDQNSFQLSDSGRSYRCQPFTIGSRNQIVESNKLFLYASIKGATIYEGGNMFFVELIHPTLDITKCKIVNQA